MAATHPNIVAEAQRLLNLATRGGTTLSLLGGVAVRLRAPEIPPPLDREYKDLDFAVPKKGGSAAAKLLGTSGYQADHAFNAVNSKERMLFHDPGHGRQVDVFVGSFHMCHEIPFAERLTPGEPTVPLAELLLTKLQIIELNEKDVRDTMLLFHGHEVADHDRAAVNANRIAALCANDWGLWRTITANLAGCQTHHRDYALPEPELQRIGQRIRLLLERIEAAPKSRGWRLRAKIGERVRWYDLPEEVEQ